MCVVFILPVVQEGGSLVTCSNGFSMLGTLVEVLPFFPVLTLGVFGGETWASGFPAGTSLKQMMAVKTKMGLLSR